MGIIQIQTFPRIKPKRSDDSQAKKASESKEDESDVKKLKKIWKRVQENRTYYGFAMCTVLFRNHPQYMKYFEDESIPEFVREAKIKKKFTSVCDTLCTLFADYHDKPSKRVYLIGYIAMIHKDMGLTLQDLNDFMSDLTEALMIELPDIMTVEHENAQNKYFSMLAETLLKFMEEQDEKQNQLLRSGHGMKKCFPWNVEPEMRLMYGYPLKYWLHKKQYWEYRRAIWASLEADLMANSMTATWTVGGRTGERRRRRRVKRRISAKRIRRRMESKKTASSNSDGTDNRTGKQAAVSARVPESYRFSWKGSNSIRQMRENFKKKFPWILVDEQGKEKTVTQSSDLKQVPDVDGALVEGTVATGITDSKRRDKKSASKKNPKGANVERTIEEKVKGVNRIEISETTKRFPDKSQLGKKVNEIARERKRQRTTYLGHTQPYDWVYTLHAVNKLNDIARVNFPINLLYEYTQETASLDSNV